MWTLAILNRKQKRDTRKRQGWDIIRPWIEKIPMSDCNPAFKHVQEGRPRYRVVTETSAAAAKVRSTTATERT